MAGGTPAAAGATPEPTQPQLAALEQVRMLTRLDPTPEAMAELARWEAAVRGVAAPPAVSKPARRAPRTDGQRARDRLRCALGTMPDGQVIGVSVGGTTATVTYAERGDSGWYEVRDANRRIVAELEVDLGWSGDRSRQVRRVLAAIDQHAATVEGTPAAA